MLRKLTLINFQIHDVLEVDLSAITTFVGESDAGKSSVLRALEWLFFNTPSGMEFLKHGCEEVSASLEVENHTVTRRRSKNINEYVLDNRVYKAIGIGVPEDIARILNISQDQIQHQHEMPFWFSCSPGEVSKKLDSIIDLGAIDHVLSHLNKEVRDNKATLRVEEERLRQAQEKASSLSWVVEASQQFSVLQEREEKLALERTRIADLHVLLTEATTLAQSVQRSSTGLTECLAAMLVLEQRKDKLQAERKALDDLHLLLREGQEAKEELCRLERECAVMQKTLQEQVGNKCPYCHQVLT